jgi:hypothetical protein
VGIAPHKANRCAGFVRVLVQKGDKTCIRFARKGRFCARI